ncbi:hypothetical protein [Bradyrhizobium sp. ORS 285]|uniref:hypothetical protein n=1 Tax=Bradyrhizobium sp. ORS 285 TaxID=115808 RepID=UPI0002E526C2|nr:hypothetical protein [Bradyrhizobium sp. ORS 285]
MTGEKISLSGESFAPLAASYARRRSVSFVSERLGLSRQATKARLHRARHLLREYLRG